MSQTPSDTTLSRLTYAYACKSCGTTMSFQVDPWSTDEMAAEWAMRHGWMKTVQAYSGGSIWWTCASCQEDIRP